MKLLQRGVFDSLGGLFGLRGLFSLRGLFRLGSGFFRRLLGAISADTGDFHDGQVLFVADRAAVGLALSGRVSVFLSSRY